MLFAKVKIGCQIRDGYHSCQTAAKYKLEWQSEDWYACGIHLGAMIRKMGEPGRDKILVSVLSKENYDIDEN